MNTFSKPIILRNLIPEDLRRYLTIVSHIYLRSNNIESFDNLEINSIDFYASVKSLYLQDRENKISNLRKGNIEMT